MHISHTHPYSSNRLHRSHITQYRCGYCKLEYLLRVWWGCADATGTEATVHAVAAEYLHSTFNSTPTCSSHSGTSLYDSHRAGLEESGCVVIVIHVGLLGIANLLLLHPVLISYFLHRSWPSSHLLVSQISTSTCYHCIIMYNTKL